jgi:hypothetical protein
MRNIVAFRDCTKKVWATKYEGIIIFKQIRKQFYSELENKKGIA